MGLLFPGSTQRKTATLFVTCEHSIFQHEKLTVFIDPRCTENNADTSENDTAMETGSSFTEELDTDHTEQVTVQPQVGL